MIRTKAKTRNWRLRRDSNLHNHSMHLDDVSGKQDIIHISAHGKLDTVRDPNTEMHLDHIHWVVKNSPFFTLPKWAPERQKLSKLAEELDNSYFDPVQRQLTYFELKHSVDELKNIVNLENRCFLRVLNMLFDSLNNVKSEKLKKKQVEIIKFVVQRLNENIDDFSATELENIIMKSGLKPFPTIQGIADLID